MNILLCSANESARRRWREGAAEFEGVRELQAAGEIDPCVVAENPHLILLHLALPGLNGIQGVALLRDKYPHIKLIIFSDVPDEEEGITLLKRGVHGYANTYMLPELFAEVIKLVILGEVWVGKRLMQRLITDMAVSRRQPPGVKGFNQALNSLTKRERELALLISQAAPNKRIAAQLKITERTVKAHLSSIFRKTGTHDRLQLALLISSQLAEDTPDRPVLSSRVQ